MNPRPRRFPGEPLWGGVVAGAFALLSFALGYGVFGREYHVAALLPVFMMVCILVAWSIHLKGDGFFRRPGDGSGREEGYGEDGGSRPAVPPEPTGSGPDLTLFAPRDDRLVPSSPFAPGRTTDPGGNGRDDRYGHRSRARSRARSRGEVRPGAVFLWGALELGVLSVLLRACAGAGSRYFGG